MKKLMSEFMNDERGQGMVEYTLIVSLIAIVAMAGFFAIGNALNSHVENTSNKIVSA